MDKCLILMKNFLNLDKVQYIHTVVKCLNVEQLVFHLASSFANL